MTQAPPRNAGGVGGAKVAASDFPCIDGLRALAALAVVLCHTAGVSSLIATQPGSYLAGFRAGVQVFFVISGFVLYRPFAQAHRSRSRGPKLVGYFRRRFLRIFPAYWLVLTVGVYVMGVIYLRGAQAIITNYLLVQTYFPTPQSFLYGLGPAWTLVVEVSFYVFLPFFALAIWRLGPRRPFIAELVGCGIVLLIGIGCGAWEAFGTPPVAVTVLPTNLAPFALGMLMAVATTRIKPGNRAWKWSERAGARPWMVWLLAGIAFSATVWAVHYPAVLSFFRIDGTKTLAYQMLINVVGLCVVIPAVFGNQRKGMGRRFLQTRPIAFIGIISYGIYLWHVPIIDELLKVVYHQNTGAPRVNFLALTLLTLALTGIVATTSWYLLEKPLIRLSHRPGGARNAIAKLQAKSQSTEAALEGQVSVEPTTTE